MTRRLTAALAALLLTVIPLAVAPASAAPRVAAGVTRGLFEADMPRLYDELLAYDLKQVVLNPARIAAE